MSVWWRSALPGSSSSPPAAREDPDKGEGERADEAEEGYVDEVPVAHRDVDTPAIRRDGDGDAATIPIEEESHPDLQTLPAPQAQECRKDSTRADGRNPHARES